ncbi:MAG: hypothetical protein F6K11_16150 [Leptolyngbya sp. SIO3F4]|nr:hypothetical protein [Leptolyngbya sp. SIO3F4]
MSKFKFNIGQVIQGDFRIKDLNLLLAFQVNCPGCFIYALPLATKLHNEYGNRLNVLGLSTAFEDFALNTATQTQRLLETGEVIGATKQYLQHQGQTSYTNSIPFAVAFDQMGDASTLFDNADIEHVCHLTPSFSRMDGETQSRVRTRVKQVLQRHSPTAYTFAVNQLQGTPSWILFDKDSTILAQWFGHKSETEVNAIITHVLEPATVVVQS